MIGTFVEIALKTVLGFLVSSEHVSRMDLPFGYYITKASSFPSGHTLRATQVVHAGLPRYPWFRAAFVVIMIAAVVYSYSHSLTEALGGVSLGCVLIQAAALARRA